MSVFDNYKEIRIPISGIELKGNLRISKDDRGIIVFSHGSGSSRMSSRNNYVADLLLEAGFSSLLFDLLLILKSNNSFFYSTPNTMNF